MVISVRCSPCKRPFPAYGRHGFRRANLLWLPPRVAAGGGGEGSSGQSRGLFHTFWRPSWRPSESLMARSRFRYAFIFLACHLGDYAPSREAFWFPVESAKFGDSGWP